MHLFPKSGLHLPQDCGSDGRRKLLTVCQLSKRERGKLLFEMVVLKNQVAKDWFRHLTARRISEQRWLRRLLNASTTQVDVPPFIRLRKSAVDGRTERTQLCRSHGDVANNLTTRGTGHPTCKNQIRIMKPVHFDKQATVAWFVTWRSAFAMSRFGRTHTCRTCNVLFSPMQPLLHQCLCEWLLDIMANLERTFHRPGKA
jgi:hypothetical protein